MINLSEVTIEYAEVIPESRQEVEFYRWVNGHEVYATLTRGDREFKVAANGEMYLCLLDLNKDGTIGQDEPVARYSDDLIAAGIKDDISLRQYIKTVGYAGYSVYHENPWWEIFADHDPDGIVVDGGFYEAIDHATELLFDDDYWSHREDWS